MRERMGPNRILRRLPHSYPGAQAMLLAELLALVPFILPAYVSAREESPDRLAAYEEITGEYEFYHEERYIPLTIYFQDGVLWGAEPGDDPVVIEPIDLEQLRFRAEEGENEYLLEFVRGEGEQIVGLLWLDGAERLEAERILESGIRTEFTAQELREDFDQLRRAVEELHPALYDFTPRETLDSLFQHQYSLIREPMSVPAFYRIIAPVMARIGCGHSSVRTPDGYWSKAPSKLLPLRLWFTRERGYVLDAYGDSSPVPPGSEVLGINGQPMASMVRTAKSYISADGCNDPYKIVRLNQSFPFFYAIEFGFPDTFRITYRRPGGEEEEEISLQSTDLASILSGGVSVPNLDLELREEEKTAILTVRSFVFYENEEEFSRFIDDTFRTIGESSTEYLIIDLRGNDGGNPFCSSNLLSYIEPRPIPYFAEPYGKYSRLADPIPVAENCFDGEVFILIDGKCFSSTGHLCGLLKYYDIGTLIGSETGGTFTCNDDKKLMHLRNTRFNLRVARGSFAAAVDGMDKGRGVIPDHAVEVTIEDLLEERDTAMIYTLDLIRNLGSAR